MAPYSDPTSGDATPVIKTPAAGPRPKAGEMPQDELQTLVRGLIESSRQYIDLELTPDRAKATRYYKGEPFGGEKPGRSAFVVTEVHDGVQAVLPNLLRTVFSAGERALEFRPRPTTPEKAKARQDAADQATDYLNYVFVEENQGYLRTEAVLKDGLIRKHGIFKWGWEDNQKREQSKLEDATMQDLEVLMSETGVEVTLVSPNKDGQTLTVEFTRTSGSAGPWIREVKPEEFICVRETADLTDTVYVAHQTRLTRGDLLLMGVSEKQIEDHGGDDPELTDDELALEREPQSGTGEETEAGKANERHLYIEGYARIDFDGDGYAELRKICTLGPSHQVVHNDPVDEIPFSVWCPDREPHSLMTGRSWADRLMDMQRLKSQLMRHVLDSASASLYPRKWYKEGDANLADLMSTQLGAPIRTRSGPNAVGEFAHTFMGKELLPILALTDDIVERRTGQSKGAAGMDSSALQSSTRAAVAAAVTATQAQQEMLVRGFVEQALKPLFKGLLKLYVKNKPEARVVKLRGKWVQVDPRFWDADMDVQVNVALGSGLLEEKLSTLAEIAAKQEAILAQMGPNNPLVTLKQYRDTMAEALALRGKVDASRYFQEITDDQIKKMAQDAANAPPPPSPEMELAKAQISIEQAKAQAKMQSDQMKAEVQAQLEQHKAELEAQVRQVEAQHKIQIEQMKLEIERERMRLEDDRERDKNAADIALEIAKLQVTTGVELNEQAISAQIERERLSTQAEGTNAKIESGERVAGAKIESGERMAKAKSKVQAAQKAMKQEPAAEQPKKSKKRSVRVKRDASGRAESYEIEDQE